MPIKRSSKDRLPSTAMVPSIADVGAVLSGEGGMPGTDIGSAFAGTACNPCAAKNPCNPRAAMVSVPTNPCCRALLP